MANRRPRPLDEEAAAQYAGFDLNRLQIAVIVARRNLSFVNEAYYLEGWKTFSDVVETPIYRLNDLFQGVVITPGQCAVHDL